MIRISLIALTIVSLLGLTGCDKYNQVDNSSTVKTPYVLFIGGYNGTLHKTNEGLYFNTLFPTDNSCVREVLVADTNVLYLKHNLYLSKNEGKAFKMVNNDAHDFLDEFYKYFIPNQMVYDKGSKTIYYCSKSGLMVSTDLGESFTAEAAANYDVVPPAGKIPTSITQLSNGTLYMMIDSGRQYKKLVGGIWQEVLADGNNDLNKDTLTWYIAAAHDTLLAIDFSGKYGVKYSTDLGNNWTSATGIPKTRKFLFGNSVFGTEQFYIGLDSGGLYRLQAGNFQTTGAGMPWYAKVSYVEGKRVVYRTDRVRHYLYCATDHGLFVSETNGLDWDLKYEGKYSTLE